MAFTIEAVEELGGLHGEPAWLRDRRREAFAAYERLPMPSRSDEEWRRTDVRGLDLDSFEPFERANGPAPAASTQPRRTASSAAGRGRTSRPGGSSRSS